MSYKQEFEKMMILFIKSFESTEHRRYKILLKKFVRLEKCNKISLDGIGLYRTGTDYLKNITYIDQK